ncbi:D-alanine--D-alanine ligase family protein [Cumulibacter manganitolerans]|uniref:D-alanine--D-alanine ligase family protein n=1 Tax=Cumulibacter manganitolerans TaxID=1884992 RepID=UPI0012978D9E|nr:D-alanine--D-alanine ligase family protein [Cumulibacter manganitolerans]
MSRTASPDRIRLVVLFGGISAEHEVSCTSAAHVLAAARREAYELVPVGITRDGRWLRQDAAIAALAEGAALPGSLEPAGTVVNPIDLLTDTGSGLPTVVLPLLHGPHGEDGTIQGLLELAGVPYVGTGVLGSAVGMDKGMAKVVAAQAGIPQGDWIEYRDGGGESVEALARRAATTLQFPIFVKPANMGSSVGISKVAGAEGLPGAIKEALQYDEVLVLESGVHGREIEVAVLGDLIPEASVPGEIIPGAEFYDYEDKYVTGGAELQIPASLDADEVAAVQELATRAFTAFRLSGLARIDFFYDEGTPDRPGAGWLLNEPNTLPGFTPYSMYPKLWEASGVGYAELIDRLVDIAVRRHVRRAAISTTR